LCLERHKEAIGQMGRAIKSFNAESLKTKTSSLP
jgi:hypothetical protein